jgi:glyoxylase-like metal-dependent hydrolase (beta-lactamase superfamily II)
MMIKTFAVGPFLTNAYLVVCEETRQAMLIDPGGAADRLLGILDSEEMELVALVATHAHIDHVAAASEIQRRVPLPLRLHPREMPLLSALPSQGLMFGYRRVDVPRSTEPLHEGDTVTVGQLSFRVLDTSGHSPGGISLLGEGCVFVGDALFADSIGRTDIPGASHTTLIANIRRNLLTLPDETVVYPGHGHSTTIGRERRYNPFLRD